MSSISRAEAQSLISSLRSQNGGISPEARKDTPPEVLLALANLGRMVAAASKTLTNELYSKDTRFVYELIQNAEDNDYSRITKKGEDPYLHFKLYHDRIVIDSNEDGFTEENVAAICKIGASSKKRTEGYIGEKGIGFKSIFKVAKKVHIQSGPFSFSFNHSRDSDENGLGMVTPMDEPYNTLPEGVHTRFILILLNADSFKQTAEELENIPDTLLLFLTKLRKLRISIYPANKPPTDTTYRTKCLNQNLELIIKEREYKDVRTETRLRYHVVRKQVKGLPKDPARKLERDGTVSYISRAYVVLAFPMDEQHIPILESQHVFAFLPLRQFGFKFLIQSDFITQASREDVKQSPWNASLLSGVADAFRDAVLQFCGHATLRYSWPRYLPDDSVSDAFWKTLKVEIESTLKSSAILRSRSEKALYKPSQLRILKPNMLDQNQYPLFPDFPVETYLSSRYSDQDLERLRQLGTREFYPSAILDLVEANSKETDFKFHSKASDDDWHTRASKLLLFVLDAEMVGSDDFRRRVGRLPLIPLQLGTWASARKSSIYFPSIGSSIIPQDLDLQLVDLAAVANSKRKRLFKRLGVCNCDPEEVIRLISARYLKPGKINLKHSISHLTFLYWNSPEPEYILDPLIRVIGQDREEVNRSGYEQQHIYFGDSLDRYGPRRLFSYRDGYHDDRLIYDAHFIHPDYLSAVPSSARSDGISWRQWLERCVGIKKVPQLLDCESSALSEECESLIDRSSTEFLGMLRQHWSLYEPTIEVVKDTLLEIDVDLVCGETESLRNTFLPLPELKRKVEEMGILDFRFLKLPEDEKDFQVEKWSFLQQLNVGIAEDVEFYLTLLHWLADFTGERYSEAATEYLTDLCTVYHGLNEHCISERDRKFLRQSINEKSLIYAPSSNLDTDGPWFGIGGVLWNAPEWLHRKPGLRNVGQYRQLESFFRLMLGVRDVTYQDFLDELDQVNWTSMEPNAISDHVRRIYSRLWREFEQGSNFDILRDEFEKKKLVYSSSEDAWYKVSNCTWAHSHVKFPRKFSIATEYATLNDFFQRILGVTTPDLRMHVQALQKVNAKGRASPKEVKEAIKRISAMNPSKDELSDLTMSNIFSVTLTKGQLQWTNSLGEFSISDRREYEEAFRGSVPMLDFSREEVRACRSFFSAVGVERKYLSQQVTEETRVTGGQRDESLTRKFRERAQAIYRCAVHYDSPRTRNEDLTILVQLRACTVFTSETISKRLTIMHYQAPVTVDISAGNLHLDEEGEFRVYVPRSKTPRELCYLQLLPRRLLAYLQISDTEAEMIVGNVINCSSLTVAERVMDDAGIIEVPQIRLPHAEDDSFASDSDTVVENSSNGSNLRSPSTGRSSIQITPARSPSPFHLQPFEIRAQSARQTSSAASFRTTPRLFPEPEPAASVPEPSQQDRAYATLLDRLINLADGTRLPEYGSTDLRGDSNNFESNAYTGRMQETAFPTRSFDRDKKVGAAGELFVFELLSQLHLPGFTRYNWQSSIRHEVCICDKYKDLVQFFGSETADIVYDDSDGVFTRLLITKGYLPQIWANLQPKYYFEVKSTTGDCGTEFYMSGSQYRRMLSKKLGPSRAPNSPCSVYIIFRIFKLEQGDIGLKLYVDPETARMDGELEFNVHTYAVKPPASFNQGTRQRASP